MKKLNIILSILTISVSLLFNSCVDFAKEVKGDGKLVTKSINISDFSKIDIETYVEVNYSQEKNTGKLEFTIDQNLWEYYDIHTKNHVLYIKLKSEYRNKFSMNPTKSVLTVSSEQFNNVDIAGSSTFNFCTAFVSEKLNIDIAGSAKLYANKYPIKIEDLIIDLAGSNNIYLAGTVQKAKIDIAGSAQVDALECEFAHLSVDIAGSGDVTAHVTQKLNVDIAGSGTVKFKGDPHVTTDIAGSGKVKKL